MAEREPDLIHKGRLDYINSKTRRSIGILAEKRAAGHNHIENAFARKINNAASEIEKDALEVTKAKFLEAINRQFALRKAAVNDSSETFRQAGISDMVDSHFDQIDAIFDDALKEATDLFELAVDRFCDKVDQ